MKLIRFGKGNKGTWYRFKALIEVLISKSTLRPVGRPKRHHISDPTPPQKASLPPRPSTPYPRPIRLFLEKL